MESRLGFTPALPCALGQVTSPCRTSVFLFVTRSFTYFTEFPYRSHRSPEACSPGSGSLQGLNKLSFISFLLSQSPVPGCLSLVSSLWTRFSGWLVLGADLATSGWEHCLPLRTQWEAPGQDLGARQCRQVFPVRPEKNMWRWRWRWGGGGDQRGGVDPLGGGRGVLLPAWCFCPPGSGFNPSCRICG